MPKKKRQVRPNNNSQPAKSLADAKQSSASDDAAPTGEGSDEAAAGAGGDSSVPSQVNRIISPVYEAYHLGTRTELEKKLRRFTGLVNAVTTIVTDYAFSMFDSVIMNKTQQALLLSYYHIERTYRQLHHGRIPTPESSPALAASLERRDIPTPPDSYLNYNKFVYPRFNSSIDQLKYESAVALEAARTVPFDHRSWALLYRSGLTIEENQKTSNQPTYFSRGPHPPKGFAPGKPVYNQYDPTALYRPELERFHAMCDGAGETLTIIHCANGSICGEWRRASLLTQQTDNIL